MDRSIIITGVILIAAMFGCEPQAEAGLHPIVNMEAQNVRRINAILD